MEKDKNTPVENAEEKGQVVPASDTDTAGADGKAETASLTDYDIRKKIRKAYQEQMHCYGYVSFFFPAENKVWMEKDCRDSELDYDVVEYTVENDEVTITSITPCKLTVSVAEFNDTLAARDDAIAKANAKINDLTAEVAELKPYKEAADKAEQERIEQETAEKRTAFKSEMLKTKLFTEDEIETSEELKAMVNNMDEAAFKAEVAERFIKNMQNDIETETAEVKTETATVRHDLSGNDDKVDNETFMRHLLGKD